MQSSHRRAAQRSTARTNGAAAPEDAARHVPSRSPHTVLAAGLAVAALDLVAAPASFAAHAQLGTFAGDGSGPGSSGSGDGQLLSPGAADVLGSTGKPYVADTGNDRAVQVRFAPTSGQPASDTISLTLTRKAPR